MTQRRIALLSHRLSGRNPWLVFAALWILLFILYYPAAQAGRVGDFPGLYADWKQYGFLDYLNRRWSYLPGMYQLTQFVTWCWFYAFGIAAWPWHMLQLSLHAASAYLLWRLIFHMLTDAGRPERAATKAWLAALLFAINPYAAESVIWEPAYHYPQAFSLQILVLLCTRKYLVSGSLRWATIAAVIFFLSAFTLEFFYLTPVFCLLLNIAYRPFPARRISGATEALWILLPQLLVMAFYFLLMRLTYAQALPRAGGSEYLSQPANWFLSPIKNALDVLLYARAWPYEWRSETYLHFDLPAGIVASWIVFVSVGIATVLLLRKKKASGRVILFFALMCIWSLWSTGPLEFGRIFRHCGDRYIYGAVAAWSSVLALLLMQLQRAVLRTILIAAALLLNLTLSVLTIADWRTAGALTESLMRNLPLRQGKTILLLNVPQAYKGIPVFAVGRESGFAAIRAQLFLTANASKDSIIEVNGYPMMAATDGADAGFETDSTLRISLQDWGRWWMRGNMGSGDYENQLFSVSETGSGRHYMLRLKGAANQYAYYRQQGAHWEEVKFPGRN